MRIKCIFVVFILESGFGWCALDVHRVNPPLEMDWNWSGMNSLFIHLIMIKSCMVTPPWTATLSKLSHLGHHTCCIRRPRYELWWPIMLGHYWLDAVEKETACQVVLCSFSKFTFHAVYYQRQGKANNWTDFSDCVTTHLECWLDKPGVEIITWAAVGVACQQHFSYNSVS